LRIFTHPFSFFIFAYFGREETKTAVCLIIRNLSKAPWQPTLPKTQSVDLIYKTLGTMFHETPELTITRHAQTNTYLAPNKGAIGCCTHA